MSRTGKIARLSCEVRDQLNRRLREGEKARPLVEWLNALPEVQAVVSREFGGCPIREQNISEWRKGGYRDWLAQQVALEQGKELREDAAELRGDQRAPVTESLAAFLSAHYAVALKDVVRRAAGGSVDLKTLRLLCNDVVALRRGDLNAQWLTIESRRLLFEQEHSIVRHRKKLRLELDELRKFLDLHHPELQGALSAFAEEVDKRQERWVEEDEKKRKERRRESICPPSGEKGQLDPGKSD